MAHVIEQLGQHDETYEFRSDGSVLASYTDPDGTVRQVWILAPTRQTHLDDPDRVLLSPPGKIGAMGKPSCSAVRPASARLGSFALPGSRSAGATTAR